jgi:predicted transposase/invertase (TIGR01784 family)
LFGDSIINFEYSIFDINNGFSKEELLKYKTVTSAIFLLDQKINPHEFLQRIKAIALFFSALNEKELQVLKHWIKNSVEDRLAEEAINILSSSKEEVELMVASNAFILTEMEENARKVGLEKGLKEGLEKGLEQGIEQGLEKGIEKGIKEIALKIIKKGKSIDEVMDLTDLSRESVEELLRSIQE